MYAQNITKLPLLFFILMCLSWGHFYHSFTFLNDFGKAKFEWLYLIDLFVILPFLCFCCVKNKKEALTKTLVLISLGVLVGSYLVPEQNKILLHYLEPGRYVILALFVLFETIAIATVVLAIKTALNTKCDPDIAIATPIKKYLGKTPVAALFNFETRMWTFALCANKINRQHFVGEHHFSYHKKDGSQSNLLGFMLVIAIEVPIMHVFLHFVWSPMAANIITALTLLSLVFFFAEYRAISRRPISIVNNSLLIRYGLYQPMTIEFSNIQSVSKNDVFIKRAKSIKRYNYSGIPNIKIELVNPIGKVKTVFLGVDQPSVFIHTVKNYMDEPK